MKYEIINLERLSSDGFKMPANNPKYLIPNKITHCQLRYNSFSPSYVIQGIAVTGEPSTFYFNISNNIGFSEFKLFVSEDGINYNELKTYGGIYGKTIGSGSSGDTQSENILRLIPSGEASAGQVYNTLESALLYAESVASLNEQILIQIEGNGVGGDVETDYNVLPLISAGVGVIPEYISFTGLDVSMIMSVASETATYTATILASGIKTKISNLQINQNVQSITTTFENIDFFGCIFEADILNDGSFENYYSFINCSFSGCKNSDSLSGVVYDSQCKGSVNGLLLEGLSVGNASQIQIISGNGYITPQRLLGNGLQTINLSSGTLTLTTGNWFEVTGTNGGSGLFVINTSGWTKASEIYLRFVSSIYINHRYGASGISTKTGATRAVSAGELTKFIYDGTYWYEINIA